MGLFAHVVKPLGFTREFLGFACLKITNLHNLGFSRFFLIQKSSKISFFLSNCLKKTWGSSNKASGWFGAAARNLAPGSPRFHI